MRFTRNLLIATGFTSIAAIGVAALVVVDPASIARRTL